MKESWGIKVGDTVRRERGRHRKMAPGDVDVVKAINSSTSMDLEKFGKQHDPINFSIVKYAPIGDPDDSPVEHPKHYNSHPSGVECITIARHHNFNIGNAFKYLWRIGLKGAKAATKAQRLEEIDKAIFYLKDERKRIEGEE